MEKPATASQLLRPRLVDVARLAGVSTATASRALSNPDLVAVSTRKAVQAAAENFGYKVNLVARSLRKQCSQAILVLIPALDNQFYPEIFHGIEAGAHRRGYAIVLASPAAITRNRPISDSQFGLADSLSIVEPHAQASTAATRPFPIVQLLDARRRCVLRPIYHAAPRRVTLTHFLGHHRMLLSAALAHPSPRTSLEPRSS